MKSYLTLGMLALVLALLVIQSFQISAIKGQITGNAVAVSANSGGAIDTTGWSEDEKMQYEHHGIMPARFQQNSRQTAQVGSC